MGKSSREKIEFARNLIYERVPYKEIQEKLYEKFGTGMSNTTLKKMLTEQNTLYAKNERIEELERELKFFKKLYFDLLEKTKKTK